MLSLSHRERLRGEKTVTRLFAEGQGGFCYPLRYVFCRIAPVGDGVRVLFTVPKKNFKRAVKRNLLRRRMKEAYRLNKHLLPDTATHGIDIALVYSAKELNDYKTIEKGLRRILTEISKQVARRPASE